MAEKLGMNTYYYNFRSTGVREIDLILRALSERATDDEIQAVADKAAEVWETLWGDGKP